MRAHLAQWFQVTGESACASPSNFDAELGRKIAKRNAREKIWALEGYLLKQRLHDAQFAPQIEDRLARSAEKQDPLLGKSLD